MTQTRRKDEREEGGERGRKSRRGRWEKRSTAVSTDEEVNSVAKPSNALWNLHSKSQVVDQLIMNADADKNSSKIT